MQERLIEYWLDSVNERTYQPAFLQMLAGEGHQVVHSTRHMPIEFGKDVISIGEDGVPCAFQLKGNPGARLTLSQFREMQPQITEMVEQPIRFPGIPDVAHRCYLVTNGEIDEEVHRAVDDLNQGYERRGFQEETRLHLISRGVLLDWSIKHASTFWADGFSIHEKLIRLFNVEGDTSPRLDIVSEGLDEILKITSEGKKLSNADFKRRQISASLFASLATRNYSRDQNHIAVAGIFSVLFASLSAAEVKHEKSVTKEDGKVRLSARESFLSACLDLASELTEEIAKLEAAKPDEKGRDYNILYLGGGAVADHFLWRARALKTVSLLSLLNIEARKFDPSFELPDDIQRTIGILTEQGRTKFQIWGEGAIPQILAHLWNQRISEPTMLPNQGHYDVLRVILNDTMGDEKGYIATPYHSADVALRDALGGAFGFDRGTVEKDTQKRSSYFAEALFHCYVRCNIKSFAKSIWPGMTKLIHNSFLPENQWEYCLWRSENGNNQSKFFEHRRSWRALQEEAADIETPNVPPSLREDPVLLLAFIIFLPHRGIPEVIRYLHYVICGTWFLPFPRPEV